MVTIQLKGRITESGELHVKLPANLKPGPVQIKITHVDLTPADGDTLLKILREQNVVVEDQ